MGLGLLFRVADECVAAHVGERKTRVVGDEDVPVTTPVVVEEVRIVASYILM